MIGRRINWDAVGKVTAVIGLTPIGAVTAWTWAQTMLYPTLLWPVP